MKKAVLWSLIGLYGVPFVMKYVRAWGDRGLNK
jgi:hypothetical protein